ncbi:hypothetical protein LZ31DRAFT_546565 [Colletotrichum somersetense]|nr:hypothetical protein LZ31DRAFT_546565 [Colletotrichum somersetense]
MVALVEALLLAVLVLPTAAVKVGRRDIPLSSKTIQVPGEAGYWPTAPTAPPNPRFAAMALKRQVNSKTCGYFEINSEAFACGTSRSCVTTNGYFGCAAGSLPSTTCLDGFDEICSTSGQGPRTLCCTNTKFPLCVTALKTSAGGSDATITAYRCGNNRLEGFQLLLETRAQSTSVPATTASTSASALGSSAAATTTAKDLTSDDGVAHSASPGPNVGAIVGGVIGGLAVIGLTVFGIFWMFLRSRRERGGASAAPPAASDKSYAYSAMPLSPYQQSPHSFTPEDDRCLSEAPAINPAGIGNNASELPSERYDRN